MRRGPPDSWKSRFPAAHAAGHLATAGFSCSFLDIWAGGGDAPWPAAPEAPPIEELRFRMGTRVACCVGKGNWVEGYYDEWGNWVAAAGLTRGRVNKFNIPKQTKDYDPQMKYCRKFIPELDSKDYPRPVQLKKFAFEESSSSRNNGGRNGPGRGTTNGRGGRRGKQNRQPRNNAFYDDDRQNGGGGFS